MNFVFICYLLCTVSTCPMSSRAIGKEKIKQQKLFSFANLTSLEDHLYKNINRCMKLYSLYISTGL